MSSMRMAVIGLGALGREEVAQASQVEGVELVAVCDEDLDRARTVASQWKVPHFFDSHRELLAEVPLDAVVVATPPHTHKEIALDIIHAGVHLLVERPLALKLSECDAILTAAARAEVSLMVGFPRRFLPIFQTMKERIERGELGEVRFLHALRFWGGRQEFSGWRFRYRKAAGGLFPVYLDEVDLLRWLGGEVLAVQASLTRGVFDAPEVEDAIWIVLEFENGALGALGASQLHAMGDYDFSVAGSKAALKWGGDETTLLYADHTGEQERWTLPQAHPLRAQIQHFVEAIRRRRLPSVTGLDGKKALEIVLAAYRSAETGRRVKLPIG